MPKANVTNAIKSALNLAVGRWIAGGVIVLLLVFVGAKLSRSQHNFGSQTFIFERVNTPASREKGLGGRPSLAQNHAMLFEFATPSQYCLWMKDMRFNIDMLWLDSAKKVIKIQENVSKDSYPQSFCPTKDAEYIIEVNAGAAKAAGVQAGQQLNVR